MRQRDGQGERDASSRADIFSQRVDVWLHQPPLSSEERVVHLIPGLLRASHKTKTSSYSGAGEAADRRQREASVKQHKTSQRDDTTRSRTTDQVDEAMRSVFNLPFLSSHIFTPLNVKSRSSSSH